MTEQQIEKLKIILESSNNKENSPELDNKILTAARIKVNENKSFIAFGSFSAASLSIAFTVCLFLALSLILDVREAPIKLLSKQSVKTENKAYLEPIANNSFDEVKIKRPVKPTQNHQPAIQIDNTSFTDIEFPTVESILDSMELVSEDRHFASNELSNALAEINLLIRGGEINNARKRYDRLRQSCHVCRLPTTLEALATANTLHLNRG